MPGVMKVQTQVSVAGPLTDSRGEDVIKRWADRTAKALGDEAVELLRAYHMDKTGRAHGGFQSNLHNVVAGPVARVKGPMIKGVVWSPWLEGTSKRNDSTSFKGYHLFRSTRSEISRRAPEVGERELRKLLPELGGGA